MNDVRLPVEIPISFTTKKSVGTIKIPTTLPVAFAANASGYVAKLPITLPLRFESVGEIKRYAIIEYHEKPIYLRFIELHDYHIRKLPTEKRLRFHITKLHGDSLV